MRTPRTVRKLTPNSLGHDRWEVSGGRGGEAEVVLLPNLQIRCTECQSFVCDHAHAVALHLPRLTNAE